MDGTCRRVVCERVLKDMLGSVVDSVGAGWKVLILDGLTTRICSSALRMSDILDAGVSVVEDIEKAREPLPLAAVYFITPSPASVARLLADFADKPLYPSVHVFFSNRVSADAVDKIKRCRVLVPLLKSLKEVNLEFVVVDGHTFSTEHPHAMIRCMGERSDASRAECEGELDSIASRLVTLLATLHEYPSIRYRAGRPPEAGDAPGAASRSSLSQRLAQKVSDRALVLQRGGGLPARESCDLLILDRCIDPLAPVVHDWTYEAMVYDLLPVEDNVIRYTAETAAGKTELREHILDEATDDVWAEYRHAHIADVYTALSTRFAEFQGKNKAVKHQRGGVAGAGMSMGNVKALIQALPQYREVLGRLAVHIYVSSELTKATQARLLQELGQLEQGIVYGDSNSSDLSKFLTEHGPRLQAADKMRLVMAYLATHPEKLDAKKRAEWQKLARLDDGDMAAVCNLAFLNVAVMKQSSQGKGLSFTWAKKKKAVRKRDGRGGEEQYTLSRFDPVLLEVVDEALASRLSTEEYPYVRAPEEDDAADFARGASAHEAVRIASARTNRSATAWARKGSGVGAGAGGPDAVASGPSALASAAFNGGGLAGLHVGGGGGRRLVVFVVGGVTRGEMRAVAEASRRSGRDVLLGSSGVLRPGGFLSQLRSMGTAVPA